MGWSISEEGGGSRTAFLGECSFFLDVDFSQQGCPQIILQLHIQTLEVPPRFATTSPATKQAARLELEVAL